MNILVFSWRDPKHPMAGGAEQVMHEHMKGWVKAGHNVTLFSSFFKGGRGQESLDGVKIIRHGSQIIGVHILAFLWYSFSKHENFDLVVDQFHGIPFFTPLFVRKPKLAVLQEVAKEVWLINDLPRPFNILVGWIGYITEPLVFLFYKNMMFMVGSNSARDDLIKIGIHQSRITIVPHGVITPMIKKHPQKEKKKTVIFLGALTRDKGIEDALASFSLLNKERDYNFWVVGSGSPEYLQHLYRLAERLKIKDKVKLFGFVSQEKKFDLLARSHVLVNPSVREGWGLVNIEANAMGTPVVAYKSQGLVDSVNDGKSGILCDTNNPESLARNTEGLLSDPRKYKDISQGAISWSKEFSWVKSKKLSLDIIEALV